MQERCKKHERQSCNICEPTSSGSFYESLGDLAEAIADAITDTSDYVAD